MSGGSVLIDRSVVEQALGAASALVKNRGVFDYAGSTTVPFSTLREMTNAMDDLRAALEQSEQEPVADSLIHRYIGGVVTNDVEKASSATKAMVDYVLSTPRKPDVPEAGFGESVGFNGLTEAETLATASVAGLVGAKAVSSPEPVAWRVQNATPPGGYVIFQQYPQGLADLGGQIEPLFTAPTQRKPLTKDCEAELRRVIGCYFDGGSTYADEVFSRVVDTLTTHGITGEGA